MDPRRLLILTALGLLPGCAGLPNALGSLSIVPTPNTSTASVTTPVPAIVVGEPLWPVSGETPGARHDPSEIVPAPDPELAPTLAGQDGVVARGSIGRAAIAAANAAAHAPSRQDAFIGGQQVFTWSPGRVFEVWTTPLRLTTLSLAPGETLMAKAAGDTVRWLIGETVSGAGEGLRTHVLLKPLEQGLQTNLVLMTNRRVYLIDLKSGSADAFNAAVAWRAEPMSAQADVPTDQPRLARVPLSGTVDPNLIPQSPALSQEVFDARYRIEPRGRRARWTPTAVFNDGQRTFIAFNADLQRDEAPALFVLVPNGETQMVNYRQVGSLYIVDRVFDLAELRLGGRRPQVVRIRRLSGAAS